MENIYKQFIDKLKEQTKDGLLDWDTVFRVSHAYDIFDNFDFILFTNEYHKIDELRSYGIPDENNLSIFLLNETFESGKDGTISEEKNLYVVEGVNGKSYKISVNNEIINGLEEVIREYVESIYANTHEDPHLRNLLRNYINEN